MVPLRIVVIGTCDTKLQELLYLRSQILAHSSEPSKRVTLIDVGRTPTVDDHISVTQPQLLEAYYKASPSQEPFDLFMASRGEVISFIASAATFYVRDMLQDDSDASPLHGIVAAGGSGNTALVAQVMRDALPLGFPKLIVSTIASGDTSSIVGETDISLTYSIVDIAGLNTLLKGVLDNAAGAIVGMACAYRERLIQEQAVLDEEKLEVRAAKKKMKMGITMFGVTTPAVDFVRAILEKEYPQVEPYVFHATGHGGRAMESFILNEQIDAVLDLTTTEIADYLVGGNMSAGPDRLDAALTRGIPCLISLGACDMVNFGPMETVPEKFKNGKRKLFVHNSQVTLMRTNVEECKAIGEFITKKIHQNLTKEKCTKNVAVWIPRGGMSALSTKEQPFENREADSALFETVRAGIEKTGVKVVELDQSINEEGFARGMVEALMEMVEKEEKS
jgi:uncharacterized protein (UPF0261 family)